MTRSERPATWDAVAVVGAACRLPGADTPTEMLDLVLGERIEIREVQPQRWSVPDFHAAGGGPGKTVSKWSGQIDAPYGFDAAFFGIHPAEASRIDPQQRLLLEEAWHCVEDAGIPLRDLQAGSTAVITSVASRDHLMTTAPAQSISERTTFGGSDYMLANRISHHLGLTGASFAIDAACASGLTVAHLGAQMLQRREADFALVGGANVNLSPWKFISYSLARMLSPTGRCHTFSQHADGFVSADGVVVLLLRRLADAIEAGDHIYGTIIGSAVNSAGPRRSLTSPTVDGQVAVMSAALGVAGLNPNDVDYVEAHGTGTPIGDPIEVEAICRVYGDAARAPLRVGAVKANIGHTEAAAGAAGLLGVLNLMRAGTFPPNVAADELNPLLPLRGNVRIDRHAAPWALSDETRPRRGAVSSFGAGGSNAHVIVEEVVGAQSGVPDLPPEGLPFLLSARAPQALARLADRWGSSPRPVAQDALADACWTLATGREHMVHRTGAVIHRLDDLERLVDVPAPSSPVRELLVGSVVVHPDRESDVSTTERTQTLRDQVEAARAILRCLPPDVPVRARGDGRLAAAVVAGILDLSEAVALVERGERPVLRPPERRTDLELGWHWTDVTRITADELTPMLDELATQRSVLVAAVADAVDLAQLHPTAARGLTKAADLSRAAGHLWWPSREEPTPAEALGSDPLLVVALACASVSDGLRRRWSLPAADGASSDLLKEVVAVLRDCAAVATVVSAALAGSTNVVDCPRTTAFPRLSRARAEAAAVVDAARLLEPCGGGAYAEAAILAPSRPDRAQLQDVLVDAWLRGADVDWRAWLAPRRRLPLPTYPFQRVEHVPPGVAPSTAVPAAMLEAEPSSVDIALARIAPAWQPDEPAATRGGARPLRVVVVDGEAGSLARVALRDHDVVRVTPHDDSARWETWFGRALTEDRYPDVVAVWGSTQPGDSAVVASSTTGVAALTRAALRVAPDRRLRVVVLAGPDAGPAVSCVRGLAVTLRRESRHVLVSYVQLDDLGAIDLALEREVGASDTAPRVRYRGRRREVFAPVVAEARTGAATDLREGFVLVTGGRGRVGAAIAAHVAHCGGTAVTVGRSQPATDEERLGPGRLVHVVADVTDRERLAQLVAAARASYGRLRGVVHCATDAADALVRNIATGTIAQEMHTKVQGAIALDEVTSVDDLEFFVLSSSSAVTFGNSGQAVYAMANAWLDDFASDRSERVLQGTREGRTVSVEWPWWGGGRLTLDGEHPLVRSGALMPMADSTGLRLLDHAIASGEPVEMPVHGAADALEDLLEPYRRDEPAVAAPIAAAAGRSLEDDRAIASAYVCALLASLTGTEREDIDLDLGPDGYGMDSIFVTTLNRRLQEDLGCEETTLVYESRTFAELAVRLATTYSDALAGWQRTNGGPGSAGADRVDEGRVPLQGRDDVRPTSATPQDAAPAGAVAIVGMAARLPGAPDIGAFWDLLVSGRSAIGPVTRWETPDPTAPDHSRYCPTGGFVDGIDDFDPLFFAMSPADARTADPQERLLLQTAWHALEDAGLPPSSLGGTGEHGERRVGVFVGATTQTFALWGPDYWREGQQVFPASMPWSLANRISYTFDLHGPSETVDTACSSSLCALHHAVQALRRGDCDTALVGAVNLYLHPGKYAYLAHQQMVSPSGRSSPFGAAADGFVPGEGIVCVVLRRLEDATRSGDRVRAVVRGTAVNHGGRVSALTVPNPRAQARVISDALADAGLQPADVDLVETHGTGTVLGDPIEARGLVEALAAGRDRPLQLGAVKGHVGHLEGAAGLAGLVKVVLQLERRELAPTLGATPPNPAIAAASPLLRVVGSVEPWSVTEPAHPRTAGISSFGAGGVNAHVIVQEAVPTPVPAHVSSVGTVVVPLSAKSPEQRAELAASLESWVRRERPELGVLARHLQERREHLDDRAAIVCHDLDSLVDRLRAVADGRAHDGVFLGTARRGRAAALDPAPSVEAAAAAWVEGRSTSFGSSWSGPSVCLSTPAYPFARDDLRLPPVARPTAVAHDGAPELRWTLEPAVVHDGPEHRTWSITVLPSDPVLDQHRVWGRKVLPAVATLEVIRRACVDADVPLTWMRNVLFSVPVVVESPRLLTVDLSRGATGWRVEVRSTAVSGPATDEVVHASGEVRSGHSEGVHQRPVDAAPPRTVVRDASPDEMYRTLRKGGLDLGPSYRRVLEVLPGSSGLSARVDGRSVEDGTWWHPSVLDSCLQASSLLAGADELMLPFMVEVVRVHGPARGDVSSAIVLRGTGRGSRRYDVEVRAGGAAAVDLEGLWVRELPRSAVESSIASPPSEASPWHRLVPDWCDAPPPESRATGRLVVVGAGTRADDLAAGARNHGWVADVVSGIEALHLEAAHLVGRDDVQVVLLDPEPGSVPDLVAGIPSLLRASTGRLRILVARTRGPLAPADHGVSAFARTASDEVSRLAMSVVNVSAPDPVAAVLRLLGQEWPSPLMRVSDHLQVSRWREDESPLRTIPLRRGGTYLVTGGHRGVGRLVVGYLTGQWDAHVVTMGRSAAPDVSAGRVRHVRGDVAAVGDVRAAVSAAREWTGRLDGVFHAAGVLRDEFASVITEQAVHEVMRPKVLGLAAIDEVTRDLGLSLLVGFSSLAAAVPNPGQSAYALANAWADAAMQELDGRERSVGRQGRRVSVLWPYWREGGMAADSSAIDLLASRHGVVPIETPDAIAALEAVLSSAEPVVAVVPHSALSTLEGDVVTTAPLRSPDVPADQVEGDADRLHRVVQDELRRHVAAVAGTPPERVRVDADIADYGLDSLAFARLALRCNEELGTDITPATLFEFQTVAELAEHVVEHFGPAVEARLRDSHTLQATPRAPAIEPPVHVVEPAAALVAPTPAQPSSADTEAYAIVGMAGSVPGSRTLDEFWSHLSAGDDMVTEVPSDRWDWRDVYDPQMSQPHTTNSKWGGFLPDISRFDHSFFGISPREAALMDPQHRMFLETAFRAIEDSGHRPSDLSRTRTGVFVGASSHDYFELVRDSALPLEGYSTTGMFHSLTANRVSYYLDLHGPSFPIDAACSSSLVALRAAIDSMRSGACQFAVVGGVNLLISPTVYISFSRAGMLSPTGRCRTFDAAADGYVRGEGVGAILIRPLQDALADGDHVHAVIRGSAVNHGGKVNTLTTPSPRAQAELVVAAVEESGIDLDELDYVEMHGTGTPLGDPIEVNGLAKALRTLRDRRGSTDTHEVVVGSVKSVVGHLEAAAGMAGLFKVVLGMKHELIPANLHLENLNEQIRLNGTGLRIADAPVPWPRQDGRLRAAGVSSFGFGGVNAHVVLQEPPAAPPRSIVPDRYLVPLSAKDDRALLQRARELRAALVDMVGDAGSVVPGDAAASTARELIEDLVASDLGCSRGELPLDEAWGDLGLAPAVGHAVRALLAEHGLEARTLREIDPPGAGPAPDQPGLMLDVAYTLACGREQMSHRVAFVVRSVDQFVAALDAYAAGEPDAAVIRADHVVDGGTDELPTAGRSWVGGEDLDWAQRFEHHPARRLPLPSYPFGGRRHWYTNLLPQADVASSATDTRPGSVSADVEQFSRTDPEVAEHRVSGTATLPGVAHLGLVIRDLDLAMPVVLADVLWSRTVTVVDEPVRLRVRTETTPAGLLAEVVGAGDAGVRYSSMTVLDEPAVAPRHVDVPALMRTCTTTLSAHDFYAALDRVGLDYGPAFRGITEIRTGPDVAVSRIRSTWRDGMRDLPDPSVLDAALQTVAGLYEDVVQGTGGTVVPFAADRCMVVGPLPATGWAVARRVDGGVDVLVVDDELAVVAAFEGLRVRATASAPVSREVTSAAGRPEAEESRRPRWFRPQWHLAPLTAGSRASSAGPALVVRAGELAGALAGHLQRHGDLVGQVDAGSNVDAKQVESVDHVWIALGVADVARAQDAAVSVFTTLRALLDGGLAHRCRAVTVVAGETFPVDGGVPRHPGDAAVVGLLRSFMHEFATVDVRLVGVVGELDEGTFEAICLEPPARPGTEVCLRGGQRLERSLTPVAVDAHPPVVRPAGRYLVVGGGQGVGRLVAEDLAARGGVVTVTGKRARETPAVGDGQGSITYVRADACDATTMRGIVAELEADGGIDGVVLSAMVLDDGAFERIDEQRLIDVLDPKIAGTLTVLEALRGTRPDFVLVLSSVQSFTGAAGQASYSAASCGQDAVALWASRDMGLPVTVVGCGPWADVGAVAGDAHVDRLRRAGWGGLDPAEGLAALWSALGSGLRHLVVLDADDRALSDIALPADLLLRPPAEQSTSSIVPTVTADDYAASELLVADLVRAALALGDVAEVPRERGKYVEALTAQLPRTGGSSAPTAVSDALGSRVDLARAAAAALPAWLRGEVTAAEVHFGDDRGERLAGFYRSDPFGSRADEWSSSVLVELGRRVNEAGRPCRVLEVGAGTGSTTTAMVARLRAAGVTFEYDATDVSERILRGTRHAVSDPQVRFTTLDLTAGIGGPPHYDAVVAGNVLHVLDETELVLAGLASRLRPGGVLVLSELVRPSVFHTLVFGMFDGWWPRDARGLRLSGAPLLDADTWVRLCEAVGLQDVRTHQVGPVGGPRLQAAVVATRGHDVNAFDDPDQPEPARATPPTDSRPPQRAATATETDADDVRVEVEAILLDVVARTLAMPREEVDVRAPFASLGVDSIVGVDLVREMSAALGVTLKTIIVFDHPSISALTDHVVATHTSLRLASGPPATAVIESSDPRTSLQPEPESRPTPAPPAVPDVSVSASTRQIAPATLWESIDRPVEATRALAVVFEVPAHDPVPSLRHVAVGPPGPGEVELDVLAFPVNFSDGLVARGLYPFMPDFPVVPGVEVAGRVRRVGPQVTEVAPGDVVVALTRPEMGGQATAVVVEASFCARVPAGVDPGQVCGVAAPYLAMSAALDAAAVPPGGSLLVTGATGSNGLMLLDLARARGIKVIGAVGSDAKIAALRELGVDGVRHDTGTLVEGVWALTAGRGVDAVVNLLGGVINEAVRVLAPEGCYVEAAVFSLQAVTSIDLSHFTHNQRLLSLNGKKLFLDHPERRTAYLAALTADLAAGVVSPRVAKSVPLADITSAYSLKADRSLIGRIVVTTGDTGATASSAPGTVEQPRPRSGDIAVVGMSAQFAGARDVDELWELLSSGAEIVSPVPERRWSSSLVDADNGRKDRTYCAAGHFMEDIDEFDAAFFGMSGKEAGQTDPQQRLFLQETWRALERAGLCRDRVYGQRLGVFVGAGPSGYEHRMDRSGAVREAQSFWGNDSSVLASRISYHLDLHGPSIAVNTACSSSLVALHMACESIRGGECDSAVAGGVFLMLDEQYYIVASNATMIAPDGRCKTFSADADGFGPGEGVGVLVLRRLEDALRDGDPVLGVIKGSAINQDGRTNGITAPSGLAQTDVVLRAWESAGVHPRSIGLVEAHGTGTRLGDPIEVDALTTAFRSATDESGFCSLGSVKPTIGHTAAAAGVAGVIKAVLALQNEVIPASRACTPPNPLIDFESSPFVLADEARAWPRAAGRPRRAVVSSFGFSGTNAHLVLEEAPALAARATTGAPLVFPVSADDDETLTVRLAELAAWLTAHPDLRGRLDDISFTLQCRRDHRDSRCVVVAATWSELLDGLGAVRPGGASDDAMALPLVRDFLAGRTVDFGGGGARRGRTVELPAHPYRRDRHWFPEDDQWHAGAALTGTSPQAVATDADSPAESPKSYLDADAELVGLLEQFVAGERSEDDVISLIGDRDA